MPRNSGAFAAALVHDVRRAVEDFDPRGEPEGVQARRRTLRLLDREPGALDRRHYQPGHVTASGVVLSPDGQHLLLVYHRRLDRWLQPGGHVEPSDLGIMDVAMREVFEETGVVTRHDVPPRVVGVGVHQIPDSGREPAHLHHDVVWHFVAANIRLRRDSARQRAVWCPLDGLDEYRADGWLRRCLARALA